MRSDNYEAVNGVQEQNSIKFKVCKTGHKDETFHGPTVGILAIQYTHIWSYEHTVYPYMVMWLDPWLHTWTHGRNIRMLKAYAV